jgi:hypothetical protein
MAALSQVVSVAEQRARDNDREAILRAELDKERAAWLGASARVASRRAAGDAAGVADAQRAQARAESDIAALQRELAATSSSISSAGHVAPSASVPRPQRTDAPWWDVYSRAPSIAPATVPSPPAASPGHP